MSSIHDGHRDRLKESFDANEGTTLNDINFLELLLFYSIPRRDTNELAHALLDRFGSLRGVLKAWRASAGTARDLSGWRATRCGATRSSR